MREKKKKVGRPPLAKGEAKAIVLQSRVQESRKERVSEGGQVGRAKTFRLGFGKP